MTIFTKIINKEIPAQIIYEDERVIAFKDINPQRPGHFLVVPKTFSENLLSVNPSDSAYLFAKAQELAKKVIKEMKVSGYNLIVNNGKSAGQEVMHTHIHIIPSHK